MGTCKYCGCTDDRPCMGGCTWVEKDVCSNCKIVSREAYSFIVAYFSDPNVAKIEIVMTNVDGKRSKVLVGK